LKFSLSAEQQAFATSLDDLLAASDVPAVHRAWADGDTAPGVELWSRLAELGVTALVVPDELGGLDGTPLDLAVAFERLGYHAVPGPWIETAALAPALLRKTDAEGILAAVAEGDARVTFALPPAVPYALDCDVSTHAYIVADHALSVGRTVEALRSVDPARRLHTLAPEMAISVLDEQAIQLGLDNAALACAATLVGAGERMLATSIDYVGARRQFGRVIGEYQAIKHALADVRVALDFARPLVHGAARELSSGSTSASRDVSAAKVLASAAADRAARTALQVHGAIGYTLECDLSIWILKTRALVGAWGTPAAHRARVLDSLTRS